MDKLSELLTKSDSEYLQQIVDEDYNLNFEVENCILDLDQFCESIVPLKHDEKEKETYQEQMQKMMMTQIEQQHQMMVQMQTDRKNTSAVKLPKLDLDMFYGNKINWWEFWDSFESIVHRNTKLSNIEKFNYLLSKLGGEAKRALAGLARTNDNYSIAVGILRERYGNKQEIIDLHYKEMLNVHSPTTKVESLRFFLDKVEKTLRSLEMLKENVNQHVFVSMIRTKLPEDVLRQLEIIKGAKNEWTVDSLRDHLRDYITACEKSDKGKSDRVHGGQFNSVNRGIKKDGALPTNTWNKDFHNQHHFQKFRSSADTFVANETVHNKPVCRYCAENHWSDMCTRFATLEERKNRIRGSCYRCLKDGHGIRECKSNKKCVSK
ncbi:uncharacterized protein LOC132755010 [Ruditapes philippinarum]|uniref:uncharacterized protein LOC132755010 n=1 Tax=Ruditapes philippinarum TaxID=129788 RepID=UPI00295A9B20|nr:uncharacterized protein LOC132755010 [Ruditapes philippinarum]